LSGFGNFKPGDRVNPGDVVGFVGKTGAGGRPLNSDPHLHYEVFDPQGRRVNPNAVSGIPGRQRNVQMTSSRDRDRVPPKPSPIVWSNEAEIEALKEKRNLEITERARERINLRIRIRGGRGIKTAGDSGGIFKGKTTVARDIASAGLDAM